MLQYTWMSSTDPIKSRRIRGIDICRSAAILAAMLSHTMIAFQLQRFTGIPSAGVRCIIQMAPPVFITLFGAMLEIAYRPRFVRGDAEGASRQLLNRAVQCYLLYVISLAALVLTGKYSLLFAIRSALLDGVSPFTDILKFYALALLIAPLLIKIRVRFGLLSLLIFAIAVHAAYPLIKHIPAVHAEYGKFLLGFLYGSESAHVGGPSFLHGMTFVVCGMIIGYGIVGLFSKDARIRRSSAAWVGGLFILAVGSTAALLSWAASGSTITGIANMQLRNENHPFWYSLGLTSVVIFVLFCVWVFDVLEHRWADGICFIGKASLFTFCFGNVLLYVFSGHVENRHQSVELSAFFFALIILQSWVFHYLATREITAASRNLMAIAVQRIVSGSKSSIAGLVSRPGSIYAHILWGQMPDTYDRDGKGDHA
jgi:hypothetical protein